MIKRYLNYFFLIKMIILMNKIKKNEEIVTTFRASIFSLF